MTRRKLYKKNHRPKRRVAPSDSPVAFERDWPRYPLNAVLILYGIVAIIGEFGILAFHWQDEWGAVALSEGLFALCIIPVYFYNRAYGRDKRSYGALKTGIRGLIIFLSLAFIQGAARFLLTITSAEEALYYNIAPIAEELCFRGFIVRIIAGNKNNVARGILGVGLSTALFAGGHVSYWSNPPALIFVIGMGIAMGTYYLVWKDLSAVILAHFLLNFIVSLPILYQVFL